MGRFERVVEAIKAKEAKINGFYEKVQKAVEILEQGFEEMENIEISVHYSNHRLDYKVDIMVVHKYELNSPEFECLALVSFKPEDQLGPDQMVEQILNHVLEKANQR